MDEFNKKKKGSPFIIIVVICVIAAIGYLIYSAVQKDNTTAQNQESPVSSDSSLESSLPVTDFGGETLVQIDSGKYRLACNDAKTLVMMISDINKDFSENPELSAGMYPDNMTPAMKKFESTMDIFGKNLEAKLANDTVLMEEVFQGIGEDISGIFQVSIMNHLGLIPVEGQNEYIDITFCGVSAPEGYVSPLEMDAESLGIHGTEGETVNPEAQTEQEK